MVKVWLPVVGYEDSYEVSSDGSVRSIDRYVNSARKGFLAKIKGRVLKQRKSYNGYMRVALSKNGKTTHMTVHRVVAMAFIGKPKKNMQVNHRDRNKENNKVANLEWVTAKENIRHARQNGFNPNVKGQNNPLSKLKESHVLEIVELLSDSPWSQKEIGQMYGVCHQAVSNISLGKQWSYLTGIQYRFKGYVRPERCIHNTTRCSKTGRFKGYLK